MPHRAATFMPGLSCLTSAPTASMVPATSAPGVNGSAGCIWYFFWMIRTSGKLTPAAATRIRTCFGPGSGTGTSTSFRSSGPPQVSQMMAFMGRGLLRFGNEAADREGIGPRAQGQRKARGAGFVGRNERSKLHRHGRSGAVRCAHRTLRSEPLSLPGAKGSIVHRRFSLAPCGRLTMGPIEPCPSPGIRPSAFPPQNQSARMS